MTPSTLVEHVADWHAQLQVDRPNRMVRNVALTGGTSKNGYRYTEQALQQAAPLYEQRPVFLDHAADKSRPQERSTRDLVGTIVNTRYESGRIRGNIRVLDTDSGRTFLALAESDAPGVGMSHVVLAERSKPDGTVARIHDVVSVDAVVFPATTTTFRESHENSETGARAVQPESGHEQSETALPMNKESSEPTTLADVDHVDETVADETPPQSLESRLHQLLSERDELLAQLRAERLRQSAEQQQLTIAQLLSESGLPDYAVTDTFRRQLAAADVALRRELLDERLRLIDSARQRLPVSRERPTAVDAHASDAVFLATLKRHAS